MLKKICLSIGLGISVSACSVPKLGVNEVCFVDPAIEGATCYYTDGTSKRKAFADLDKYTAFSVENATKINAYVEKCQKAHVHP